MDINQAQSTKQERVVRVTLGWILLGGIIMVGLGILGGLAASWWNGAPLPALPETQDRLITTIQEVTISPSVARTEIVEKNLRSVVLLALSNAQGKHEPFATGVIVTSDGVLATTATLPEGEIVALGDGGEVMATERAGADVVFGITYLRMRGGVFVPVDVRDSDLGVGYELLAVSRNPETLQARTRDFALREYQLSENGAPAGWQRTYFGSELNEAILAGAPLFDDEGRVAALALKTPQNTALPSTVLRQSLARVVNRQLEAHRWTEAGLTATYVFAKGETGTHTFLLAVTGVTPGSRAAQAGLKAGDRIEKIQGEALRWEKSVYEMWNERGATALQVRRGEAMLALTIAAAAETP